MVDTVEIPIGSKPLRVCPTCGSTLPDWWDVWSCTSGNHLFVVTRCPKCGKKVTLIYRDPKLIAKLKTSTGGDLLG